MSLLDFKEEHILLVSSWWANILRQPAPSSSALRSGEEKLVMSDAIRLRFLSPSPEKIDAFESKLASLLRSSPCPDPWEGRTEENWAL